MIYLTNALYWVSTGLLIPTIVMLLLAFIASLLLIGGFYGQFLNRKKLRNKLKNFEKMVGNGELKDTDIDFNEDPALCSCLNSVMKEKKEIAAKAIADYEIEQDKELNKTRVLTRTGPMLGLMGTLIPMGPALTGLASGDIASMALNMQVAFSTTVVGIFIGAVGYILNSVKERWAEENLNTLHFFFDCKQEKGCRCDGVAHVS